MALPTEGPNDERRRTMTKRDGTASDHLLTQAAATPQDELVAGLSGNPESIPSQALLAQVLDRANLRRALKQVRQNKGAPGLDGMTVEALPDYLRHHWPEIREQLEAGRYRPQPVKRVEIDKADGKKRPLGIPTVLDRFIQQAIAQVISALWEPHFHPQSYGFRPKRSAHQAVRAVQANIRGGYHWVVDMDLQAFSGSNGVERAIGNCANAACLCVQRGIPASPHTVHGGCRRRRPCRSRSRCASSNKWDYRALRRGRNLLHRTAGYVTRSSGGAGGGGREAFSYPDWASVRRINHLRGERA